MYICTYGGMGVSALSLYRESTDSLLIYGGKGGGGGGGDKERGRREGR